MVDLPEPDQTGPNPPASTPVIPSAPLEGQSSSSPVQNPQTFLQSLMDNSVVRDLKQGFGDQPLGPGPVLRAALTKEPNADVPGIVKAVTSIGRGFNEGVLVPALEALDAATRGVGAVAHAAAPYTGGLSEYVGTDLGLINMQAMEGAGPAAAHAVSAGAKTTAEILADTTGTVPRIPAAAIKYNDKVYTGTNHIEALSQAAAEHATPITKFADLPGIEHGFINEKGEFESHDQPTVAAEGLPVDTTKLSPATLPIANELKVGPGKKMTEEEVKTFLTPIEETASTIRPAILSADDGVARVAPLSPSDLSYIANDGKLPPNRVTDAAGHVDFDGVIDPATAVDRIQEAAEENGEFQGHRNGGVPIVHLEAIEDAMGTSHGTIDPPSFAQNFRNAQEVARLGARIRQSGEELQEAARAIRGPEDFEGKKAFWRKVIQHKIVDEAVEGKVSEWGYTGHELNKIYGEEGEPSGTVPVREPAGEEVERPYQEPLRRRIERIVKTEHPETATEETKPRGRNISRLIEGETQTPHDVAEKVQEQFKLVAERAKKARDDEFKLTMEKVNKERERRNLPPYATDLPKRPPSLDDFDRVVKNPKDLAEWVQRYHGLDEHDVDAFPRHARTFNSPKQLSLFIKNAVKTPKLALKDIEKEPIPTWWDKTVWLAKAAWLSGVNSHAMYAASLFGFANYEAGVIPAVAGLIGKARTALGIGASERAMMSEAAGRLHGLYAGIAPAAKTAFTETLLRNKRPPLPGQVTSEERGFTAQANPFTHKWIGNVTGGALRVIGTIGTFYRDLGFHSVVHGDAMRATLKEGLKPGSGQFLQRYQYHVMNPTDKTLEAAAANGSYMHYVKPIPWLGQFKGSKVYRYLQLQIPFLNVPINIAKIARDNSPAAWLSSETRADMLGKNGGRAQDTALARMVVGSAIVGWAVYRTLNDQMTDQGPSDPTEYAIWRKRHAPGSTRIGDYWTDNRRLGPLGDLLQAAAGLAEVGRYLALGTEGLAKGQAAAVTVKEYEEAAMRLSHAAGHMLSNPLGLEGLSNVVDAVSGGIKKQEQYISNFAASMLPYSVGLAQTASAVDPWMRDPKTFIDQLRMRIPATSWNQSFNREDMPVKRDWSGLPIPNPSYRGGALLKNEPVSHDPVNVALSLLNIKPAPLQREVDGLGLDDNLWNTYQSFAGFQTHKALEALVTAPTWYSMPPPMREKTIFSTIRLARDQAKMMVRVHPDFVQQAIENKLAPWLGTQPKVPPGIRLDRPQYQEKP